MQQTNLQFNKEKTNLNFEILNRLSNLKKERFLIKRIFQRLSENMHYETFKYLNCEELLEIRASKLGGYLLVSNALIRSRIKNYFQLLQPRINNNENMKVVDYKIKLIFEQLGEEILYFERMKIGVNEGIRNIIIPIIELNPELKGIKLGNI